MIIIVKSLNVTPEDQVNERIGPLLAEGYRIASATTSITTHGNIVSTQDMPGMGLSTSGSRSTSTTSPLWCSKNHERCARVETAFVSPRAELAARMEPLAPVGGFFC